ncbi:micos subunit MIC26 [Rhypophila decipiens]|uniref:MICOS complex subunit n=1 Tax=Rhypophila decipiens TaxID=261697 RepID=A0AAN7B7V4_9PEZI|nr:micos subunit MIC26 [Rhypophila decipiens]
MAARVLLQRRAAPVSAALLVGSIAFVPSVAFADASDSSKKPIYDDFDSFDVVPPVSRPKTVTQVPSAPAEKAVSSVVSAIQDAVTPSASTQSAVESVFRQRGPTPTDRLAAQIGRARLFLYKQACTAEDAVNAGMSRAFDLEQSFTSTIASLAPPRESNEKVMPGLIYVLVAGMAGSIVARNRNILLRTSLPLALGIGAAWAVIPVTMNNMSALAWKYEQRFPAVADAHIRTREGIEHGWTMAKLHTELAQHKVAESVTEAREKIEAWVRKGK